MFPVGGTSARPPPTSSLSPLIGELQGRGMRRSLPPGTSMAAGSARAAPPAGWESRLLAERCPCRQIASLEYELRYNKAPPNGWFKTSYPLSAGEAGSPHSGGQQDRASSEGPGDPWPAAPRPWPPLSSPDPAPTPPACLWVSGSLFPLFVRAPVILD